MKKLFALLVTPMLVLIPTPAVAAPINVDGPTVVIAHKTGPFDAPENTHQGIAVAKSKNPQLTWVEVDVRWSKSNFPHLMHNATVDATTDHTGNLRDYWFTNVLDMNAAAYQPWNRKNADGSWQYPQYQGTVTDSAGNTTAKVHPSYAWEFLNEAKKQNVDLLLDVKDVPNQADADKLMEYINRFSYANRVMYMSSPAGIKAMRSWYPQLNYIVGEYPPADMTRTAESLKALGASGYGIPFTRITKTLVDYYHANNLKVLTWTSDSREVDVQANWDKMIDAGVDALITNQHVAAQKAL